MPDHKFGDRCPRRRPHWRRRFAGRYLLRADHRAASVELAARRL